VKKAKPAKRRSAPKSKRSAKTAAKNIPTNAPQNFDQYLATVPQPARPALIKMRALIRSAVPPAATETISYRIPAFRDNGILIWFAAFTDHCSLFPTASIIASFKNELMPYSTSKGTIHFPLNKPLPRALIKKIVKARVAQQPAKSHR
jgi:uncharacterized protein YdhG (YjbR/CyaY superfamily)